MEEQSWIRHFSMSVGLIPGELVVIGVERVFWGVSIKVQFHGFLVPLKYMLNCTTLRCFVGIPGRGIV